MPFCVESKIQLVEKSNSEFQIPTEPHWYLAYGSNLAKSTFQGRRGIKPLKRENVLVEGLELTFDLPGLPYLEPRFANCRIAPALDVSNKYDPCEPWTGKGALLGVIYLVTPEDFKTILATEGGGLSYQPVIVDAAVLSEEGIPTGEMRKAYTLLAKTTRPVYGEPSLRYMNIIRQGARENSLPPAYIKYLDELPHYRLTSIRQKLGRIIFFTMAMPLIAMMLSFTAWRILNKNGNVPSWANSIFTKINPAIWGLYDKVGKWLFGDGEKSAARKSR